MESERFDAITKWLTLGASRRGAAVGLAALAARGLGSREEAEAKKRKKHKKKKKRCRKLRQSCGNAKNKRCCGSLTCEDVSGCDAPLGAYCCANVLEPCGDPCDCCTDALTCVSGACCLAEGAGCDLASECCPGFSCIFFSCQAI